MIWVTVTVFVFKDEINNVNNDYILKQSQVCQIETSGIENIKNSQNMKNFKN